ncbi:MAG: beta-galactosidase [Solirubrobacterales bacterium]
MKRRLTALLLTVCLAGALLIGVQAGSAKLPPGAPKGFFGIGPQTGVTQEDASYMRAGGIESIRVPVSWAAIQPTRNGGYDWAGLDEAVETATRAGLRVLPFLYTTPRWLAGNWRTLPVNNGKQRSAWQAFLRAAVERYGPGGDFWNEHAPGAVQYEPAIGAPLPIRTWQIWNEANFFYFAHPVSPARYAKLAMISGGAIKSVDPSAQVVLSGLFGEPTAKGARGMDATDFLSAVYRKPGIKSRFDGIALHPYAVDAESLEEMIEGIHEVTVENHDRPGLYITEMGWGSQNNFQQVAFEQGVRGQVKQLRAAYGFMLENYRRLNLKGAYWFSWKDLPGSCNFCDSVGLFRAGPKFRAKPAWHAFVAITGGRARP